MDLVEYPIHRTRAYDDFPVDIFQRYQNKQIPAIINLKKYICILFSTLTYCFFGMLDPPCQCTSIYDNPFQSPCSIEGEF